MDVTVSSTMFDGVWTPRQFAAFFRRFYNIREKVADARVEANPEGHGVVVVEFPRSGEFRLTLDEVAEIMDCHYALLGWLPDRSWAILPVGEN